MLCSFFDVCKPRCKLILRLTRRHGQTDGPNADVTPSVRVLRRSKIWRRRSFGSTPIDREPNDGLNGKILFEPAYKDVALAGVYEISKILTGAQSLERTLGAVIAVLSSFMQMRRGFILALDEDGEPEITASSDSLG